MKYKAFKGPDGWYVGLDLPGADLYKPSCGGTLTKEHADRLVKKFQADLEAALDAIEAKKGKKTRCKR